MMNRYSIPMNSNPDERVFFFYWEDVVNYLREEVEADGNTFRYSITHWKESGKRVNGKRSKAVCQLMWMRINQETKMAEMVSKTVTCEDNSILPLVDVVCGDYKRQEWAVGQW